MNAECLRKAWLQKSGVVTGLRSGRAGQNTDKRHPLSSAAPQPRLTLTHGLALGGLVLAHTDAHLNSSIHAGRRVPTATLAGFSYRVLKKKRTNQLRRCKAKRHSAPVCPPEPPYRRRTPTCGSRCSPWCWRARATRRWRPRRC